MRILGWAAGGMLVAGVMVAVLGAARLPAGGKDLRPDGAERNAGAKAEDFATRAVRARLREPDAARFHDVRAYRFGPEGERAVCGRVGTGEASGVHMDFVVRVILPEQGWSDAAAGSRSRPPLTIIEEGPGVPFGARDARRRYCREAAPAPMVPPAADAPAPPVAVPAGPGGMAAAAGLGGVSGATTLAGFSAAAAGGGGPIPRVVVRSPANVRAGPGGGAAVLQTAPRGREFEIHGRAPGGWVQVGEGGQPSGWVHSSLLGEILP